MTKPKTTKKPTRRPNARDLRAAMHEARQTTYNLDLYEAYCAGFARATQHNDVADLCMFFDCDRHCLCNLQDVVSAVSAYTAQPSTK